MRWIAVALFGFGCALLGAVVTDALDNGGPGVHRVADPWSPVRATTDGDCTGFAVPEYLIRRESNGNPSAYNPRGRTYGCAQLALDLFYAGRRCQGLNPFTIDGQRTCTARMVRKYGLTPWPESVR